MLDRKPETLASCRNALPLVVSMIERATKATHVADEAGIRTAIQCKLFWMVGIIGRETITVKDLKRCVMLRIDML